MKLSILLGSLFFLATGLFSPDELRLRVKNDPSLVAPGFGSEGVVLGETVNSLVRDRGRPDRVAQPGGTRDLFREVFGQAAGPSIRFDHVYHYTYGRFSVFLLGEQVVAVAVTSGSAYDDAGNLAAGRHPLFSITANEGLSGCKAQKRHVRLRGIGIAVAVTGVMIPSSSC